MIQKTKLLKVLICLTVALSSLGLPAVHAETDDAGVLGGVDLNTDLFIYFKIPQVQSKQSNRSYVPENLDGLYFSRDSDEGLYYTKDKSVGITIWRDHLAEIFIFAPGYKTDKGIEVGMTLNNVKKAYGPIYSYGKQPSDFGKKYGIYYDFDYAEGYRNYASVEYVTPQNEGLNFVINKNTGKIVLIVYQFNRHGTSPVMSLVENYRLLPQIW